MFGKLLDLFVLEGKDRSGTLRAGNRFAVPGDMRIRPIDQRIEPTFGKISATNQKSMDSFVLEAC